MTVRAARTALALAFLLGCRTPGSAPSGEPETATNLTSATPMKAPNTRGEPLQPGILMS